ncbi:unnamed protein product [Didymodactylos carnosus]|uniref:Uncharacterized protein n=1 Tax=Didymodactylos carnosus TaxID=1234261 RepID=A0A815C2Q6_9BILA|nr:unnamed protein product [Didymodactylos carnosus]CAF4065623.1 unnamed protein product [Didymodactylos carnosus]
MTNSSHDDVVKFFIEEKWTVNRVNSKNETPIYLASKCGHLNVEKYLLKQRGYNCLEIAITQGHKTIVEEYLLNKQHKDEDLWTKLIKNAQLEEINSERTWQERLFPKLSENFEDDYTPMRKLIKYMPDVADDFMSKRLTEHKDNGKSSDATVNFLKISFQFLNGLTTSIDHLAMKRQQSNDEQQAATAMDVKNPKRS